MEGREEEEQALVHPRRRAPVAAEPVGVAAAPAAENAVALPMPVLVSAAAMLFGTLERPAAIDEEDGEDDERRRRKRRRRQAAVIIAVASAAGAVPAEHPSLTGCAGCWETDVPKMDDAQFRQRFRMRRIVFDWLADELALEPEFVSRNPLIPQMPVEKQLALFLHRFGGATESSCSLRNTGDLFRVSEGAVVNATSRVCQAVLRRFAGCIRRDDVRFPELHSDMPPGYYGAIDSTLIRIKRPVESEADYVDREGNHSLHLQVVADSHLRFVDLFAGWPGRANDGRVWQMSPLYEHRRTILHGRYVLGDAQYPLSGYIAVPEGDDHVAEVWKRHSAVRVDAERAIGHLKSRFRALLGTLYTDTVPGAVDIIQTLAIVSSLLEEFNEPLPPDAHPPVLPPRPRLARHAFPRDAGNVNDPDSFAAGLRLQAWLRACWGL